MAVTSQKRYIIDSTEGYINSKSEIRKSKLPFRLRRRGYTIVEIVVVMGIAALITTLGAAAFLSVRTQYLVDDAMESTVTAIRDAQNRAIAFTSAAGADVKIWHVYLDSDNKYIQVGGYYKGADDQWYVYEDTASKISLPSSINMAISYNDGINDRSTGKATVSFVPPFATTYLHQGDCTNWVESNKPTKEYIPVSCTARNSLTITLSGNGTFANIILNNKGDIETNYNAPTLPPLPKDDPVFPPRRLP